MKKRLNLLVLTALIALGGCNDEFVNVSVDGESYTFRKSMVLKSGHIDESTSDEYGPLILRFKGFDIKAIDAGYPIEDNAELTAQIYFNYSFDVQFMAKPYLMTHEFKNGTYEYDPELKLYRVFNEYYKESHKKFYLLTKRPSTHNSMPSDIFDFYEGGCLYLQSQNDYRCKIYIKVGDHAVLANAGNKKSLYHREELKKYIMKVLSDAAVKGTN